MYFKINIVIKGSILICVGVKKEEDKDRTNQNNIKENFTRICRNREVEECETGHVTAT